MKALYPPSIAAIRTWAVQNNVTEQEARLRYAQYSILRGIAGSRTLHEMLVFKGGNALDFIWQPNRSTSDLDFSADMATVGEDVDVIQLGHRLHRLFDRALASSGRDFGVTCSVNKVARQPPRPDATFVTYTASLSYALQDEPQLLRRMAAGEQIRRLIQVDISLNEPICADLWIALDDGHQLRVSTIEDIVAEKLRALLQQKRERRNRTRRQDLLDIAVILRTNPGIDRGLVAQFLCIKAVARNVPVSRDAFHDPEIAERAGHEYSVLAGTTRHVFIPFSEALSDLLQFTDTLDIPADHSSPAAMP